MGSIKHKIRHILKVTLWTVLIFLVSAAGTNGYILCRTAGKMQCEYSNQEAADCALVLGAGLKADGTPNFMLLERLDKGIELYRAGAVKKLLMSGDHGKKYYDEVRAMRMYALEKGVPAEDIFSDHAGFSTYESVYRAQAIFEVEQAIIVSQRYHLYRALYTAEQLGIQACGAPADKVRYGGQTYRELREFLARSKDFVKVHLRMKPTFLGEKIPIGGDGTKTLD